MCPVASGTTRKDKGWSFICRESTRLHTWDMAMNKLMEKFMCSMRFMGDNRLWENLVSHIGKMFSSSSLESLMTWWNTVPSACAWSHPQANFALLGGIPKYYSDLSGGKLISNNFLAPLVPIWNLCWTMSGLKFMLHIEWHGVLSSGNICLSIPILYSMPVTCVNYGGSTILNSCKIVVSHHCTFVTIQSQ